MRPIVIPASIRENNQPNEILEARLDDIRAGFKRLLKGDPEVSVVLPAYNEETSILKTLSCFSKSITNRSVEVIVVNNNSSDNTEAIVLSTGARCVKEPIQGITQARNTGLAAARGKYILNADADSLYPPHWIEQMAKRLDDNSITSVYGRFGFLPTTGTWRIVYFFYETMGDAVRWYKRKFKEEAVNVFGCNSGFRKEQALQVDGFNHPPSANEDGYLALKLRNKGFGRLQYVSDLRALAWTSDRRIQRVDGGIWNGFLKRFKSVVTKDEAYWGKPSK